MITLPNGSFFILDESELDDVNCVFEELINIEVRDFFDKIITNSYLPLKYNNNGIWNTNFNIFDELFGVVAVSKIEQELFNVYEMPWGEVYLIDCNFDFEEGDFIIKFANRAEYMASLSLPEPKLNPQNQKIDIDVKEVITVKVNEASSFYEFNSQTQIDNKILIEEIINSGTILAKDLSGEEMYFDIYLHQDELYAVLSEEYSGGVYKLIKLN